MCGNVEGVMHSVKLHYSKYHLKRVVNFEITPWFYQGFTFFQCGLGKGIELLVTLEAIFFPFSFSLPFSV